MNQFNFEHQNGIKIKILNKQSLESFSNNPMIFRVKLIYDIQYDIQMI